MSSAARWRSPTRTYAAASPISAVLLAGVLLTGCSGESTTPEPIRPGAPTSTSPPASPAPTTAPSPTPAPPAAEPPPRVRPGDARVETAVAAVRHLAGRIGPRPGASPEYRRAAAWVEDRLAELGWQTDRQPFRVPDGSSIGGPSEGLAVAGGRSLNVVATRGDVRAGAPWLLVGAHLDTVPRAPGAEDNASGVGVLLAVAEALAGRATRLPVVLAAFGSEEPRGPSDDEHHYGSRTYVASLTPAQRRSLRGMVSLDRVGVGAVLPVGSPSDAASPLTDQLRRAAERAGVPTVLDTGQRSSDHWSFAREGLPGARLGSTPYAGYHSSADLPAVVSSAQLERTARTVLAWLR